MDLFLFVLLFGGLGGIVATFAPIGWKGIAWYTKRQAVLYWCSTLGFVLGLLLSNTPALACLMLFGVAALGGYVLGYFRRRDEKRLASEAQAKFAAWRQQVDRVNPNQITRRDHELMSVKALEALLALPLANEPKRQISW